MESKYKKIYVEWWKIRRSTVTGLIIFVSVLGIVVFGGWWAIKNNWFVAEQKDDIPKNAARIISFEGDVRITRAATRETIVVTREIWAAAGDTIQTQAGGRAIVQMIDGSVVTVRPDSSIVIRDNSSIFGGNNVRILLDDGQLNVKTEDQPQDSKNIVEMRDSETQVRPQSDVSFNADERGAEIRVSRGGVETTVGGTKTAINENQFASVNPNGVSQRESILPPPRLGPPGNLSQLVDSTGTGASIGLNWQAEGAVPIGSFYLQVARSGYFAADSILVDRADLTTREYRLGGLIPGTYYWRVKATARSGQTSEWSEPFKFGVARTEANRTLDIAEIKVDSVGGRVYYISGRTQPGVQVRILGSQAFAASDGSFRLQISTQLSETEVELNDDKGNRAGVVISLKTARIVRRF